MADIPGKYPFGWNKTPGTTAETQAKTILTSPDIRYKNIISGSPEIEVTDVDTSTKKISLLSSFSSQVYDHETRISTLETDVGDGAIATNLESIRTATTITLADSDNTLTISGGRRYLRSSMTTNRVITLSTTGANIGDEIFIQRTDTSQYSQHIINGGPSGKKTSLNAPGSMTFRFDGTNWILINSTITSGSAVLNVRDFGAKGDGVTDDSAALQAFFNALCQGVYPGYTNIRHGFIPAGNYRITQSVKLQGNGSNTTSFVLCGESHSAQSIGGSLITYDGPIIDDAVLKLIGVSGSKISGISVHANSKALYAGMATLQNGVDLSSQNVIIENCIFYCPKNGGAAWGHGPTPEEVSNSSDVSYFAFRDCKFYGDASNWTNPSYTFSSFYFRQSNNVMVTKFDRCFFNYATVGISNSVGSNLLTCDQCDFNLLREWCAEDNGFSSVYRECYCEVSGGILAGTNGQVTLERCRFNIFTKYDKTYPATHTADDGFAIYHPNVNIIGGYYREFRHRRSIINIDINTNKVRLGPCAMGAGQNNPIIGSKMWIWSENGEGGLPQVNPWSNSLEWQDPVYIIEAVEDGQGTDVWDVKFSSSLNGPELDFVYAGNGTLYTYTRWAAMIGSNGKADLRDADFDATTPHIPAIHLSNAYGIHHKNQYPTNAAVWNQIQVNIKNCRTGQWVNLTTLPDITTSFPINPRLWVETQYSNKYVTATPGQYNRAMVRVGVSAVRAARVLGAGNNIWGYISIPARTRITGIFLIVEEAFAGGALSSATFQLQRDGSIGGVAGELIVNTNVMIENAYGFDNDSHLGSLINRSGAVQGGYAPSNYMKNTPAGESWPLYFSTILTGATANQLTAGKLSIWIELEKFEKISKTVGYSMKGSTGINTE